MTKKAKTWTTILLVIIWMIVNTMVYQTSHHPSRMAVLLPLALMIGTLAMIWMYPTETEKKPFSTDDKISKLKELEKLKGGNVISEEEFQVMKKDILK